ncbi:MAG: type II secretion system F family protein [Firmicutes bacterium]|nr:type II secretion system F family protein [Bacillota bacterium]
MNSDILIKRIYSKKSLKRLDRKITSLGSSCKLNINKFLNLKLILLIFTFLFCLFYFKHGYILSPIITIVVYLLYDYYYLDYQIKKRVKTLEHDAIFFFEVLALTLQSDRNLKLCLEITSDAIDSDLSLEFKVALKEVKLGKSLTEALEDLKKRIPSKTVNNVLLNVIESNVYGNSIVDSLNNQIEYLTDKRILEIKGKINKMPTKISVVSVLLFIPLIMLLILGPVLINYFVK